VTYLSAVLADAPVHYWRCADPGGALLHDVGSSPRALVNGLSGAAQMPYIGPTSDGGSAYFDLNNNGNYGDGDLALTLPFSLECWCWIQKSFGTAQGFVSISNGALAVELGIDATLHPHAFTPLGTLVGAAALTRQAWHHLVLTCTLGACILYADAFNVNAGGGAAATFNPFLVIGSGGTPVAPTRFAHAALAECAVYPVALAAGRVTAHFAAADLTAGRPVFRGGGSFDVSLGTGTFDSSILPRILADVEKVY
jgi:hypothetical protein